MFTGIVEEVGELERITGGGKSSRLRIRAKTVLEGTQIGDSISTCGVCLTVTALDGNGFEADVMAETLRRSNLGNLRPGSRVNLERAMQLGGRFGGHIVSGHIDGTGLVRDIRREDRAVWLTIGAGEPLLRYIIEKGAVAIDGVSLTVASVHPEGFSVSVIPHTGRETTLLGSQPGTLVNLECDLVGKYVERLMGIGSAGMTELFLKENGF